MNSQGRKLAALVTGEGALLPRLAPGSDRAARHRSTGCVPTRRPPFGGAEGHTQFVTASGRVLRPGAAVAVPVERRALEIARSGEGRYLTDLDVDGAHLRVLTRATGNGGAVQVSRPLDEIDSQLSRVLLALAVLGAVGVGLGVALGALVARAALVPIGRFTGRTEKLSSERDLSYRIEWWARTSSRGWRAASTRHSTRWRARWRPSASP